MAVAASLLAACAAPPAAQPAATTVATAAPASNTELATAPAETTAEASSGATPTPAPAADSATVRVSIIPNTIGAPLYVAYAKGYFIEEGMNVQLLPVESGSDTFTTMASGNADVAFGGISAGMLNAVSRGIDFEIVAPLHTERPPLASPLVVSKERYDSGELKDVASLKGKKVAVNSAQTASLWWLKEALAKAGLDVNKDVEVVALPFGQMAAALQSKSIDGAILTEPVTTGAEQQGLIVRISEDFLSGFTPTVLYFNKDWATKNPELAQKFVKAYLRGARDLNGDGWSNEDNLKAIEQVTKVPLAVLKVAKHSYHDPNGVVPVDDLMQLQAFFRTRGDLKYDKDIDLSKYVNSSYAEKAVAELGGKVEFK